MNDDQRKRDEQQYASGSRMAWLIMLGQCLRHLGIDDPEAGKARWAAERMEAVQTLRKACERHGDNEWSDDLHLADVIDKHLLRHIDASAESP